MSRSRRVPPGSTVGILGGGQLGRMLALAGHPMGYRFVTLDPTPESPCGQVVQDQVIAAYDDQVAAERFAEACDVITYEFENVDAEVAGMLEASSYVPQGSQLLYTTQHRLREKAAIEKAGATVAPYRRIDTLDDLHHALAELGYPAVLKTATGGYDGKGQWVIRAATEIEEAFSTLSKARTDLVLEQWIPFYKELSVIAARTPSGEVRCFPIAENVHVDNILHLSIVPARVGEDIQQRAVAMATSIAESMGVVGLIAVEMFLTEEGQLYVNELAPRPHNSGHYTMDACVTSQFEQHLRAICDLPLTSTELTTPVVMVNLLGEHLTSFIEWWTEGGERELPPELLIKPHLYGKEEPKAKRKMGHVNVLTPDIDVALKWIRGMHVWRETEDKR